MVIRDDHSAFGFLLGISASRRCSPSTKGQEEWYRVGFEAHHDSETSRGASVAVQSVLISTSRFEFAVGHALINLHNIRRMRGRSGAPPKFLRKSSLRSSARPVTGA